MQNALRILLIDDDPLLLDGYSLLLASQGYDVLTANTGARGVELAARMAPDIVLLDVILPDMEGFDVCQQILAASGKNAPIDRKSVV